MKGDGGLGEKNYVLLKDLKVELRTDDYMEDGNGGCIICFWVYINICSSFPSVILEQKSQNITSGCWPFLCLDEKKKLTLFPLLFLHQGGLDPANSVPWKEVPCATSKTDFSLKRWVHVGCEVLQDFVRLHIDGEIVGEKSLPCTINKDLLADALRGIFLTCPNGNEDTFNGYVYGMDVSFPASTIKEHFLKDCPLRLSMDHSIPSEIEEDIDGVWSIVGGKASCRRIFSLDIVLLDAFGCSVNKELEVVASLLYADNGAPVENTNDGEPPLLISYDGIEFASPDRPCKLINGRASFKLKISQLSSKCENRLFRIRFDIPKFGRYPFLEALTLPIHCVSRYRNTPTASLSWRKASSNKTYYINGCESSDLDDGSAEHISTIIRQAKPSPSSKRIKLGHDKPFAAQEEYFPVQQSSKEIDSHASITNEDNAYDVRMDMKPESHNRAQQNSSASESSEATNSDPNNISSPISDSIVFKYCMGGPADRFQLLKEIAASASEDHMLYFADQVSLYSGCFHHRPQIVMAKRLLDEGKQAWTSISGNNDRVPWETLVLRINKHFMKISRSARSLTDQDLECLRRIAGCRDFVSLENFERMWYWLYPVAFNLSKKVLTVMWDSLSPLWIEGFISKEDAEFTLHCQGGFQDPGTFVLRFPTSRSWPHPDAGNLVVTYVGSDHTIHHSLLSLDSMHSSSLEEMQPLQNMLLREPMLSRLARVRRVH
ncbi:SH2 domain-containing protein B-like [Primulina huaijiensis]|uniref:SH2 domain-containing protein B-like n=1 Tax=Primulina huaijiensis TaxID=1492673 RepID=UPI003CC7355B